MKKHNNEGLYFRSLMETTESPVYCEANDAMLMRMRENGIVYILADQL